jgi:hypothetical protein
MGRSQALDAQLAALGAQEGLEFRYDLIARRRIRSMPSLDRAGAS